MKKETQNGFHPLIIGGLLLILAIIATGGLWFQQNQANFVRQRAESELKTINLLKTQEIAQWRTERLANANSLMGSLFFVNAVATWLKNPQSDLTHQISHHLEEFRRIYHYRAAAFIDIKGEIKLATPPESVALSDEKRLRIAKVLQKKDAVFGEFHKSPSNDLPSIDIMIPLLHQQGGISKPIGVVILDIDPQEFLYPLLNSWPIPSTTAETLLVRRDGEDVLFLNNLRHRANTALLLRIPLTQQNVPAVQAVQGKQGIQHGVDYRGVPVLSAIENIPNTNWFLVTKIDTTEAFADIKIRTAFVIVTTLALFALLIGATILWVLQTRKTHFKALRSIEWLLAPKRADPSAYVPVYGDLSKLNTNRTILDAVGAEALRDIADDFLDLLGTSSAIYERNGDYALGIFSSGWCRAIDQATFNQTGRKNVQEALACGNWNCHESCWTKASKESIASGEPIDIECNGGIRLYTVPIRIGDEIIGAINCGYGDPPRDSASLEKIARENGVEINELRRLAEDYEPRPQFIIDIARNRLASAARLIALLVERKRFEQTLAAEREQLAVTMRSIGDAVISTNISGKIVLMNRVAEEMTGWRLAEARDRPLDEVFRIIDQQTRSPYENLIERILKSNMVVTLASHVVLIARDGTERNIADSGAPIKDKKSQTVGVVIVFRDVTMALKNEAQLLRTQKLESIGLLAGGIAHDFNNLLGGIFGHLEMARYSAICGEGARTSESLAKALTVFERAKNLTQQLLTFSKGGAPRKKTGLLSTLIEEVVPFALSGSNVRCQFDLAPSLWPCDFDEGQIVQVIDNIVINAKHAMARGGELEVCAENIELAAGERQLEHGGRYIRLSFKDHGVGIPKENLSKIFDPFFSTKQTGSGLGLATSHSIIHQHDGFIEVQSEQGKGSTFFIYLPASTKSIEKKTVTQDVLHTGYGRILVMDDEEFIREVISEQLSTLGYTVTTASHGQEAILLYQTASQQNEPFDLVILDMTVPGGWGGIETIKELLKIDPAARVILSSGYSGHPAMTSPGSYGFADGIQKPYEQKQLAALVARLLNQT